MRQAPIAGRGSGATQCMWEATGAYSCSGPKTPHPHLDAMPSPSKVEGFEEQAKQQQPRQKQPPPPPTFEVRIYKMGQDASKSASPITQFNVSSGEPYHIRFDKVKLNISLAMHSAAIPTHGHVYDSKGLKISTNKLDFKEPLLLRLFDASRKNTRDLMFMLNRPQPPSRRKGEGFFQPLAQPRTQPEPKPKPPGVYTTIYRTHTQQSEVGALLVDTGDNQAYDIQLFQSDKQLGSFAFQFGNPNRTASPDSKRFVPAIGIIGNLRAFLTSEFNVANNNTYKVELFTMKETEGTAGTKLNEAIVGTFSFSIQML